MLRIAAALATTCFAHEFTPYASQEDNGDFPAVTTPMTFEQTAGQDKMQVLTDQTKADPDPPQLGGTATFTVSGLAHIPLTIETLEFKAWLFGVKAYDESYPPSGSTTASPGTVWTSTLPFDIPAVAPSTEYDVEIDGNDADGNAVFSIRTAFRF